MTQEHFIQTNGIALHYLDHAGAEPPILLMPGLTLNAHSFDGLIAAGLNQLRRVIAVDLRGRGLSDKPETGYTLADHAADILGLLDGLGLEQVILGGHSFGGLVSYFMAYHHPERVRQLILFDSAATFHPRLGELIAPAIQRLGQPVESMEAYLRHMRQAPHLAGYWSAELETFYRADVAEQADGTVIPLTALHIIPHIAAAIPQFDVAAALPQIKPPAMLINATGPYGPPDYPPVLPQENAQATAALLPNCRYVHVGGNHFTMVFGENARQVVQAIREFVG